jgi:hypothetical protein
MKLRTPCFWYLACGLIFAFMAYVSIRDIPDLMEKFRSGGMLLPVPFIIIKQLAAFPAIIAVVLLCLFAASFFWAEMHSSDAIQAVSFCLMILLIIAGSLLFMAIYLIGYGAVAAPH